MNNVSVSVIDYLDIFDDGISVLLSIMINDKVYEAMYWFDKDDNYKISIDDEFYIDYEIDFDINIYGGVLYLRDFIEKNIPDKKEILKKFNKL